MSTVTVDSIIAALTGTDISLSATDVTAVENIHTAVRYQGLDLIALRSAIITKLVGHKDLGSNPKVHILKMLTVFLNGGNNFTKIIERASTQDAKRDLSNIRSVIQLKDSLSGLSANDRRTAVTGARLASCFPEATCLVAIKIKYRPSIPGIPHNVPPVLCTGVFGAMLPASWPSNNQGREQLYKACAYFEARKGKVLKRDTTPLTASDLEEAEKWMNVSSQGHAATDVTRISYLVRSDFGLFTVTPDEITISPVITDLADEYDVVKRIRSVRLR